MIFEEFIFKVYSYPNVFRFLVNSAQNRGSQEKDLEKKNNLTTRLSHVFPQDNVCL
jgi:hypothetical protein